jgi:hypothetical protein
MRPVGKIRLVITVGTVAMALLSCSSSGATEPANESTAQANAGANANARLTEDEVFDFALRLCAEHAGRRFGFAPDIVNGGTFAGGGDSRRTTDGQMNIMLPGPPRRYFRCEIAEGEVTSVDERDENNDLVGPQT